MNVEHQTYGIAKVKRNRAMRRRYTAACLAAVLAWPVHAEDPQRAFDFEFGAWTAHIERLVAPLSGSDEWVEHTGTSVVHPWWDGRANVGELRVTGPGGDIQGMSLRLYEPASRQWFIRWANARTGELGSPMVGGFEDGIGTFYNQEQFNGRTVFVRFIFSDITEDAFRLEQAFSADGGASWEPNWLATFERAHAASSAAAAIRSVWTEVDAAWNARDPVRFSALYTDASSFEFVDRRHTIDGRAAIHRHFEQQFARTPAAFSHHTRITNVRPAADGVAIADGIVEVRRASDDPRQDPSLFRTFAIFAVMVPVGAEWQIDALRVYELPEPDAP